MAETPLPTSDIRSRAGLRRSTLLALCLLIGSITLVTGLENYHQAARGEALDLRAFYLGAEAVARGESPYRPFPNVDDYVYPPFFACAFIPFSWLPVEWAAVTWAAVNGALWGALVFMSLLEVPLAGVMALLPSLFSLRFLLDHGHEGQVNLLLACLVVGALVASRRGRPFGCGLLLGVAASIKLLPGLFVLYHLWRRQWRVGWGALLAAVLCAGLPVAVVGPSRAVELSAEWVDFFSKRAASPTSFDCFNNQSLLGALMVRLTPLVVSQYRGLQELEPTVGSLEPRTVLLVFAGLAACVLAALAVRLRGRPDPREAYALLFLSIPLLSRVAWVHYYVFMIFVYTVLIAKASRRPWIWWPIAAAVFLTHIGAPPFAISIRFAAHVAMLATVFLSDLMLWGVLFATLEDERPPSGGPVPDGAERRARPHGTHR